MSDDLNAPPEVAPIPPALKLLQVLTSALRTSTNHMVDSCSHNQDAMDQVAVNEEILNVAEPQIERAMLKLER